MMDEEDNKTNVIDIVNDAIVFPQSRLLIFTSRLVILCWVSLGLSFIGLIIAITTKIFYPLLPFLLFFPSAVLYGILAFVIKCPKCKKAVTVQPIIKPQYVNENKFKGINGWGAIILNVFLNKQFTCMHCGTKYFTE